MLARKNSFNHLINETAITIYNNTPLPFDIIILIFIYIFQRGWSWRLECNARVENNYISNRTFLCY